MKLDFDVVQVDERDGQPRFQILLVFYNELGHRKDSLGGPNVVKFLTTRGMSEEEALRRVHHAYEVYRAAHPRPAEDLHDDELLMPVADDTAPRGSMPASAPVGDFWRD